jgi:hypothetical protein
VKKVVRNLGVAAATAGLAVTVTACGNNVIGADGPKPGIAAQVDDHEITLDDLSSVVDGLCTLQEADATATATSRTYAQSQILQAWVSALIDEQYADDHDLAVSPPDSGLEQAPGWDDVSEDDQDALESYVDSFVYSSAVKQQLGKDKTPDASDYDISINPKFDVRIDGASFVPAGDQLSVPVSKEAKAATGAPPSADELQTLPDDQLCGKRPAPPQPTLPLPVPSS